MASRFAASQFSLVLAARDLEDLNDTASDIRVRYGIEVQTLPFEATDVQQHESFWNNCIEMTQGKLEGVVLLQGSLSTQFDAQRDLSILHETIAVNYTSLGYGDIHPIGSMRAVAVTEALTGLMMIGWSASFTYLKMEQIWQTRASVRRPKRSISTDGVLPVAAPDPTNDRDT